MMTEWFSSPPVALVLFLALVYGLYRLAGRYAARGPSTRGKHSPYACGEDLSPETVNLSYQGFFRLALLFVVVHMATLVLATLSRAAEARPLVMIYLIGVTMCVDVLRRES